MFPSMIGAQHPPCDEGLIRAQPRSDHATPRKRLALAATVLGSSMAFIDGSVVNVALPAMRAALKADAAQVQWIVNAYLLLLGALVLIGGSAGDRYGRRKMFVLGVVLFGLASLGCALAPDVGWLIAARAAAIPWAARRCWSRPAWPCSAPPSATTSAAGRSGPGPASGR
jgi:MFS family permease